VTALVMELVEGEDLLQRIARGPVPLDEALPIARQIAEALLQIDNCGHFVPEQQPRRVASAVADLIATNHRSQFTAVKPVLVKRGSNANRRSM
jgi:serine/threonine protein kinase